MACAKDIEIEPLAGSFDVLSRDGTVPSGTFRLLFNVAGDIEASSCILGGWHKFGYDRDCFLNQDLHDQMLGSGFYYTVVNGDYPDTTYTLGGGYSSITPGTTFPAQYGATLELGPFCGYWTDTSYPDFFVPNAWIICDQFIGWPYNILQDPASLSSEEEWTVRLRSNSASFANGQLECYLTYDSVSVGNGQATDSQFVVENPPSTQSATFTFCLPDDATNVAVVAVGLVTSGPTNTGTPCATGGTPAACDFSAYGFSYLGSTYNLCYTELIAGYTTDPVYGTNIPVYGVIPGYEYEISRNLYYLPNRCRESLTFLFPFKAVTGVRRLLAGTKSRLYVNNDRAGNWRVLADGLGGNSCHQECDCSDIRFAAAQLGNYVVLANGFDPVIYWKYDDGPAGDALWSADYVSDLQALGITSARIVAEWKGFIIIGDVVENGTSYPSRFYWSDADDPLSFLPFGESLAGYHDVGRGERLVNIVPMDGRLVIYTDSAIYEADIIDDTSLVFRVEEIYRGPHVPRFPYAIASSGDLHIYASEDSIYVLYGNSRTPLRLEWIHRAGSVIYRGIESSWLTGIDFIEAFGKVNWSACRQMVAGYDAVRSAFWFSWPTDDSDCPNKTLVIFPRYQRATIVDHGFTAFAQYQPDLSISVRDYMELFGICDASGLLSEKEGEACDEGIPEEGYDYLINPAETADDPIHANSVLAALCDHCTSDYCVPCEGEPLWLMASATDKCIKQFDPDHFVREMVTAVGSATFPETATATYADQTYCWFMQMDPFRSNTSGEKLVTRARVEFTAEVQSTQLEFSVATGEQPGCMAWSLADPVDIECLDGGPADDELRPGEGATYNFHAAGRWIAWRLWIEEVGGPVCFSRLSVAVNERSKCW